MFPLNQLLTDYDKRRRLVWTDETRQAFEDMKIAIHECPSLFFMDDDLPVFLHTDASKYGIGAYLFQLTPEGTELPIAFISKTLTESQTALAYTRRKKLSPFIMRSPSSNIYYEELCFFFAQITKI